MILPSIRQIHGVLDISKTRVLLRDKKAINPDIGDHIKSKSPVWRIIIHPVQINSNSSQIIKSIII